MGTSVRPYIHGKFLKLGDKKFYIKGVTYGTFAPDKDGYQFPKLEKVETDFILMNKAGINTVRTYTVPPKEILDLALLHNLKIMIGLPWEQHLTFLDSKKHERNILNDVRNAALGCNRHPAILCYAIGNEIPAQIVRWYGAKRMEKFIYKLYSEVKAADPDGLITYVNYPTTEYLDLSFLDFYSFNVYLEEKRNLIKYLSKLHNLIGDKPLILAEIGLDSLRNGKEMQGIVLDWQIRTVFELGCAGAFVFAWTDEWWRGGAEIEDWDFGLVDRNRNPKPALKIIKDVFEDVPFTTHKKLPRFSVVVCSYNGAKTIRDTMNGLKNLDYPDYEVIVVNDGSKDKTAEIVSEYDVKLITTENRGLSNARNTGMYNATGEIVAYIDDDAYPDPHWLKYLASAYMNSNHGGIGGPNIHPVGDGPIAECVANSPGGPLHVLSSDEVAEHIPGCNMSFKRAALLEIEGFDPRYRAAGDDVDVCWRIQNAGYTIGFHPSAIVWHHCRNSFKMYWKQQQGYGKAEALLEKKWPERYNIFGHLTWAGRIYGNGLTKPIRGLKKRIFYGSQGTALFQSVYQPAPGFLSALPLMPEWYILVSLFGLISLLGLEWPVLLFAFPLFLFSILIVVVQAAASAKNARFSSTPCTKRKKFRLFAITTFMHIIQPYARLKGRIKYGLNPWKSKFIKSMKISSLFIRKELAHWSEEWKSAEDWLTEIKTRLEHVGYKTKKGDVYDRWDLRSHAGLFASVRLLLAIEEYGQGKQYVKVRKRLSISLFGILLGASLIALTLLAIRNQAIISAAILGVLSLMMGVKILIDFLGCLASLEHVFQKLPTGIREKEESLSELKNLENIFLDQRIAYKPTNGNKIVLNLRERNKINGKKKDSVYTEESGE